MTGAAALGCAPGRDRQALEQQFLAAIAAERQADRRGAAAFFQACRDSEVDALLDAVDFLNDSTISGWRLAMRQVGKLPAVSAEIRAAFLNVWIEAKHLPLVVEHRPTMARALHILMPPVALASPLRLFRGTAGRERRCGSYGFSWSTQIEIARTFAEQARQAPEGAVLLEAVIEPGSVHLVREEEGYYDESEVVVDPYRLKAVRVVERLSSAAET